MTIYNIYCDESCHLEQDHADIMVLGALLCPKNQAIEITKHIKWLKHQHNYRPELKWSKLHNKQWGLYKDLIDLFVNQTDINFKATIVMNKQALNHEQYNENSHNTFYYKMFYFTLRDFLQENNDYRIYLDYMDTHGSYKSKKLTEVLTNGSHGKIEPQVTIIRSYESVLIQLCDLIIGAIAYKNRTDIDKTSEIKNQFVCYLEQSTKTRLNISTPQWEKQFNLFKFQPKLREIEC